MTTEQLVTAFVTLFVIIDPIGLTPLFVALTQGTGDAARRRIGTRAILVAFGLLTLFGLAGQGLLRAIGIGMPAFGISGGLLLFLTAVDMLFERRSDRRERTAQTEADQPHDPSVFPLAMPLIAGPGALASRSRSRANSSARMGGLMFPSASTSAPANSSSGVPESAIFPPGART